MIGDWVIIMDTTYVIIPQIVTTGVKVLSIDGNDLGMVPGNAIAPGTDPQQNIRVVGQAGSECLQDLGAVHL